MKCIYFFDEGREELKKELGHKGVGLAEMYQLGLPVPLGFTISSEVCSIYHKEGRLPEMVKEEILAAIQRLEIHTGHRFAFGATPLLLSVRSGAEISIPGLMDTVLNVGMNQTLLEDMLSTHGDRFVYDLYRRLLYGYAVSAKGLSKETFLGMIKEEIKANGVAYENQLDADSFKMICAKFLAEIQKTLSFPQNPYEQLWKLIEAVFDSWNHEKAIAFRKMYGIAENMGVGVTIQAMVYGNANHDSATGVAFSKNVALGKHETYAEYLPFAQGEDVTYGIGAPLPIEKLREKNSGLYAQLEHGLKKLRDYYKKNVFVEFTIEDGVLYFLQARSAKQTYTAEVFDEQVLKQKCEAGYLLPRVRIAPSDLAHDKHWDYDWFMECAIYGDPISEDVIGMFYEEGSCVPHDPEKAFYWYERSAKHGFLEGMLNLAYCYYFGFGVEKDDAMAAFWNQEAADQGSIDGIVRVLIKQCLDNDIDIKILRRIKEFSEKGNLTAYCFLNEVSDADR